MVTSQSLKQTAVSQLIKKKTLSLSFSPLSSNSTLKNSNRPVRATLLQDVICKRVCVCVCVCVGVGANWPLFDRISQITTKVSFRIKDSWQLDDSGATTEIFFFFCLFLFFVVCIGQFKDIKRKPVDFKSLTFPRQFDRGATTSALLSINWWRRILTWITWFSNDCFQFEGHFSRLQFFEQWN